MSDFHKFLKPQILPAMCIYMKVCMDITQIKCKWTHPCRLPYIFHYINSHKVKVEILPVGDIFVLSFEIYHCPRL